MCKTHQSKDKWQQVTCFPDNMLACLFFNTTFKWYLLIWRESHLARGKACFLVSKWLPDAGARDSSSAWWSYKSGKLEGYWLEKLFHFSFLLQKSKKMHVTPHAILVLSMYKVSFFGWGRRKWVSIAKSMASLALSEDFSATQITLMLFHPQR